MQKPRTGLLLATLLLPLGAARCTCGAEPIEAVVVELRVSPQTLDFGALPVGATLKKTLVVANSGNGPYAPEEAPELTGDGFALAEPCALPMAPGGFCEVEIAFSPRSEGALAGTYVVHGPSLTGDDDLTVALTGTGEPTQIVVDPPALDFGAVTVGESARRSFTVENRGGTDVELPLVLSGDGFFVGGALATTLTLAGGDTATVDVDFSPPRGGALSGQALVELCGEGCGPVVALTGSGDAPRIDVQPRAVDFGDVPRGEEGVVDVVITNVGAGDLVVTRVDLLADTGELTIAGASAIPFTVASGGAGAPVTLSYAPVAARGALGAVLRIRSSDPVSPDVFIPVDGESAGPALSILPAAGQFGVLDAGDTRTLDVVLRSTGTVPAELTAISLSSTGSFAFVTPPPLPTLVPGEAMLFTLVAEADAGDVAAGGATATLTVAAVDVDDLALPLAFFSGTSGCQPRAPIANLGFGSVVLGQGTNGVVAIQNVGDAPCTLDDAAPAPGLPFDPGFSFSAARAQTIPAGLSGGVDFAFRAEDAGQKSAFVRLSFAEQPGAPLLVSATGRGVTGTLVGEPPVIELGPLVQGCTSDQRSASFVNKGGDTVIVNGISLDPPNAPFALSAVTLPATLPAGAAVSLTVESANNVGAGLYAAEIVATSDDVDATVRVTLDVQPAGARVTETFEAADISQVDVLFVVDDSGSMADDQDRLATNFDAFIASAFTTDTDVNFHLGITTTDVLGGTGGPLVDDFLTRSSPSLDLSFADQAIVGTNGNGFELGLEAMRRAIDDFANNENAGFLRQNAALSVVIVSDEEDNGGDQFLATIDPSVVRPVEAYIEALNALKAGSIENTPVLVSAVVNPNTSPRYTQVANAFGGVVLDILDATWGEQLSDVGAATFGLQRLFRLGADPNPSSIDVLVNGAPVAFTQAGRAILLVDDPPVGAIIEITYEPGCAP